jgi:hypothetical protein
MHSAKALVETNMRLATTIAATLSFMIFSFVIAASSEIPFPERDDWTIDPCDHSESPLENRSAIQNYCD